MSAITSAIPETGFLGRHTGELTVAIFSVTAGAVYGHVIASQSVAAASLTASLLLTLLIAPAEYGLGAIAAAFLAAASMEMNEPFRLLRWVVLAFGAVVLLLRFFLRTRIGAPKLTRFSYLLLVFLAISAFTLTTTAAVELAALKLGAVVCMFFVASYSAAHLADSYGPSSARQMTSGLLSYTLVFVVLALPGSVTSAPSLFRNANTSAALLATVIPWLPCQLSRRFSRAPDAKRSALILGLAATGYVLLATGSRAALLGVLLAVTWICLVHSNRQVAAGVTLAAALSGAALLANPDLPNILAQRYIFKYQARSGSIIQSRAQPWQVAAQNIQENPWLGLGFGVTSGQEAAWSADVSSNHAKEVGSSFWAALVSIGILGAAPLFLAILVLLVRGGRFAWKVRDPWLTGLYGSVLALAANAVFEGWLLAPGNFISLYFWAQCFFLDALIARFQPACASPRPFG